MKSTSRKPHGRLAPADVATPDPVAPDRGECIASAAYFKAEAREFLPGRELEDWLEAEAEFEARQGR